MENRKDTFFEFAKQLFAIDSPSGYTHHAIAFLKEEAEKLGFKAWTNAKGNLFVEVEGEDNSYTRGICAHADTLGLMVRSIKGDGKLAITNVGGPLMPTIDGEYCRVYTREGKVYTGTILSNSPSVHVFKDASSSVRECDTMEIRLDEVVKSKEDTLKLGISNGDFIAIDPKTTVTESGFIKSRFLDDKISVACLFQVLKEIKEKNLKIKHRTLFIVTVFEEVGHGNSSIPQQIRELLAVDMGCIGLDLACTEYDVSICAKDSSGPYDYQMTSRLIDIAKQKKLNYAVDIYPMYGSDVSAALRGGNDIKGALIGPGVHASHGMERTHWDGLNSTIELILGYLM
ncbi:MAG: M42 family metallopeptidase [Erysipelotrichaceae bacterium]|nr:M42 family metallopeptidase [Erysipelotrichaceae bacterium]